MGTRVVVTCIHPNRIAQRSDFLRPVLFLADLADHCIDMGKEIKHEMDAGIKLPYIKEKLQLCVHEYRIVDSFVFYMKMYYFISSNRLYKKRMAGFLSR